MTSQKRAPARPADTRPARVSRSTRLLGFIGRPRRRTRVAVLLLAFLTTLVLVAGPQITLLFSDARPAVEALSHDVAYIAPGGAPVEMSQLRGIIGTRPITVLDLPGPDTGTAHDVASKLCSQVTDRIDDIIVVVIVNGEFTYGCEGDSLPVIGDRESFDLGFWLAVGNSTTFTGPEIGVQVQQVALQYDSEVHGHSLRQSTRTYRTLLLQFLLALAIALAVVVGVVVLFLGLRRTAAAVLHRRATRREWQERRQDIESDLSAVALTMIDQHADPRRGNRADIQVAGRRATRYLHLLDEVEKVRVGHDLDALSHEVADLTAEVGLAREPAPASEATWPDAPSPDHDEADSLMSRLQFELDRQAKRSDAARSRAEQCALLAGAALAGRPSRAACRRSARWARSGLEALGAASSI